VLAQVQQVPVQQVQAQLVQQRHKFIHG